jgi:putative membrane protein
MDDAPSRFDVQPTASNHFAWLNTYMSLQRTLMAGLRTGISLIGFGFTVAQFFERMQGKIPFAQQIRPEAPRNIGLTLIAAGIGLIGLFLWQYHLMSAYLWAPPYDVLAGAKRRRLSGAYWASWVVLLIGVVAFVSVFERF